MARRERENKSEKEKHAASELDSINRSSDKINVLITGLSSRDTFATRDDH